MAHNRHLFALAVELLHLLDHGGDVLLSDVVEIEVPVPLVVRSEAHGNAADSVVGDVAGVSLRVGGAAIVAEPHAETLIEELLGEGRSGWVRRAEPSL